MDMVYGAADFKAHCLRILDEVAESGQAVRVSKRGKPTVRIIPDEVAEPAPAYGFLRGTVVAEDSLFSTDEVWHADQD